MEKVVSRFKVRSETGQEYEVQEIQNFVDASSFDGPATIPGRRRFALSGGGALNYVDDQTLKIVASGQVVRRV